MQPFTIKDKFMLLRYMQPVVTSISPHIIELDKSVFIPINCTKLVIGVNRLQEMQIEIII